MNGKVFAAILGIGLLIFTLFSISGCGTFKAAGAAKSMYKLDKEVQKIQKQRGFTDAMCARLNLLGYSCSYGEE